ncbi:MAG: (Fe-S)-binding protein [Candidatus Omnitrophota bacterium]|jgi:Fe-S oxidoreductase|nr:MAG: (Fe-S)-binding protein [Candidatus Omnitrophota bacterium]
MIPLLDQDAILRAKANTKKPETMEEQGLRVRYHVENPLKGGRAQRFLEAFAAILKHSSYGLILEQYVRTSLKCARCAVSCMLYEATGDPKDVPCYRSAFLIETYRRHFTLAGSLKAKLFGDPGLTDETIEEMADSFYNCTACRKCVLECPAGIDHGLLTHLGRYILSEIGITPRALVVSVREQVQGKTRNTSAIPIPAMIDSCEFLEEEIEEAKGAKVKFPIDQEGAEHLFFAPVSDYMMEADTLCGIAAVLHQIGASWTIGTKNFDGINYGLFYSDIIMDRVLNEIPKEVKRLKTKKVLIGECGHASRTAKVFLKTFCEEGESPPVVSIIELTHAALKAGKLKLDPNVVTDRVVYHDPCNMARKGWIIDQPREILRAFCKDYVEMTPNGRENYCCGGGGGTVSIDELRPYRTSIAGKKKAEQLQETGAKLVVAPCANCKKQLREVVDDNGLDCEIVGLHDLIFRAIILQENDSPEKTPESTIPNE